MTGKCASMLGAACVGILLGAAALLWAPMAGAQGTFSISPPAQPSQPAKIDRSLIGSRKGILTRAQGTTVWINGIMYSLAPGALVESRFGDPLQASSLKWDGVEFDVQYWVGIGSADRQITQLIITFPQ
jgi:hypothetical protein